MSGEEQRDSGVGGHHPLEPTAREMKEMAAQAMERIARFIETLPEQPASDMDGAEALARALSAPMPEHGAPLAPILDLLFDRAAPKAFNTAGPGYLAYIPGGGLFEAGLADLIADAVNRFTGIWAPAPLLVQLEADVLRWLCGIVGYGPASTGFLTTGGSLANLSALITARHEKLGESFGDGAMYVSDQAHHSVRKAARLAGFPEKCVRAVPVDDRFRLRPDALLARLAEDRAAGLRPFLIVASAGTTNTGAVDPLADLADIAAREGLWLHVDGAYGGFFVLTERGRRALAGIERADSITLDPHKGMFLPYGTGCLLAKDGGTLRRAHSMPADYLPVMQENAARIDFSEISPELSRDYRGLRVWLPLQLRGTRAFATALDEKLDLAEWAHEALRAIDGIEIVAAPQLSLVGFRLRRPGLEGEALDDLNRDLLARINARKRVYLSATTAAGRFVLRICVLSFRTHRERMEMALEDIRAAVTELR
jgi:aromatic-L-amino-acid decarboxylase